MHTSITEQQPFCYILVPVYNALAQTARCLESIIVYSTLPYRLVVISDASDATTTEYLRKFALTHEQVVLLENEHNLGFLHTANRGLRYQHEADKVSPEIRILLNSDTVVTAGWLESFARCFHSDSNIGIATAVSNNAENLSVNMPQGFNVHTFSRALKEMGSVTYPDITTAIGFCMGIRQSVIEKIGGFDDVFSPGYGEDSDLHFRILCQGLRSVLVPDCFIYHESHASFSEQTQRLMARNRPIFDQRWKIIYSNEAHYHEVTHPLETIREHAAKLPKIPKVHDVLFIVPTVKLFGGIIVVYEIVNRLIERGVDANVIALCAPEPIQMQLLFSPYFCGVEALRCGFPKSKLYVATHHDTCLCAIEAHAQDPQSKLAYLIQGYESWFPGATINEVVKSYGAFSNRVVVSSWLSDMLSRWGHSSVVIPNGVDTKFFYPLPQQPSRKDDDRVSLITMFRDDPQGGWRIGLDVIKQLKREYGQLYVIGVGNLVEHEEARAVCDERHPGVDRKMMRDILRRSDIFLDASMIQGFGLMGLEAMACGVAPVLSKTGGCREYADEDNAVLCELGSVPDMTAGISRLIEDPALRSRIANEGLKTAQLNDWEFVADRYHNYIRSLLHSESTESADEYRSMLAYVLSRATGNEIFSNYCAQVGEMLSEEVSNGDLRDIERVCTPDLQHILRSRREGAALVKLYREIQRQLKVGNVSGDVTPILRTIREILPQLN